jgi:hypothetical protein
MTSDLAPADDRMPRTICPCCGVRLCVDGEERCLQCLDRAVLARQTTLDQRPLEGRR